MKLSRNRWLSLGIVAVVAADWLTKLWVQERLPEHAQRDVVAGWISLLHKRNEGVAFSFLAGESASWRFPLLVIGSLVGIALCARLLVLARGWKAAAAAGLVLAGAVGNLGDRVLNGAVTDFILVQFFPFVFNVADVAITLGAVLLVAHFLLDPDPASPAEEQAA